MAKFRSYTAANYQQFLDQGPTVLEVILEKYPGFSDIVEPLLAKVRRVLAGEDKVTASPDDEVYRGWGKLSQRMSEVLIQIRPVGVVGDEIDTEGISSVTEGMAESIQHQLIQGGPSAVENFELMQDLNMFFVVLFNKHPKD